VEALISERLHSIEQLEVLLLLHAYEGRWWTTREISQTLRVTESLVASALSALRERKLARYEGGRFRYADTHDEAVSELARCYAEYRVETLVLLSSKALERVRLSAVRTFAEAFRLRDK
jgi:hypothetical protein